MYKDMEKIYNSKVKETLYSEKLENGLTVMIIPKKGIQKKYIIWGTHYGSMDNKFIVPGENEITEVPEGVAHFLEHKLFEQENGVNSLDRLTSIGVDANAYTTNDHTAYLFECTDHFYEALDEFMDYVQNPYFTDENVEKEKGIISQEIKMDDDYPDWKVYFNALKAMYKQNPIRIEIAGSVESITEIDKEILYKCYNTFYNPSNMCMVVSGDFEPEELLEEIKKRLVKKEANGEVKRIFEKEQDEIVKEYIEQDMKVSRPLYTIAIKCNELDIIEKVKTSVAIEIILYMLIGKSSKLYKELYQDGNISNQPSGYFEYGDNYAHIMISGTCKDPKELYKKFKEKVQELKNNGLNEDDFKRVSKMIYGDYIKEYNDVSEIARMFLADFMRGINSFEYLDAIDRIDINYLNETLNNYFKENKMILSVVK